MNNGRIDLIPDWAPDWLTAIVALALVAAVTAALFGLARRILRRALPRHRTLSHSVLRQAGGFAQYAFTMLAAALVAPALPLDKETNLIIERLLFAAFIVLLGRIAIAATDIAINRYMSRFDATATDNLSARKAITQIRLLKRTVDVVIVIITIGFALMTFDAVRQFGISLFASAGIAGLAVGFAAKPLLENLVAGVQLAITQPFRIDDVVIVNDEFGWVEEISSTYVVIRCWDWRRLVVPLSTMMNSPFQNWTRQSSQLIGSVYVYADYAADVDRIRTAAEAIVKASPLWDGKVFGVQVTDVSERSMSMQVRVLASALDSGKAWDLRCAIREKLIAWMREDYPQALPRRRNQAIDDDFQPMPKQHPAA